MNTLVLDIETTPFQSYGFQQWKTNIYPSQVTKVPEILCFAWKWHGEGRTPTNFEAGRYHPEVDSDKPMALIAQRLLSVADAVVTFNGDKFDIPHLNRLIRSNGLTPPSPYKSIDLRKTSKQFLYPYHSLDYICGEVGIGHKRKSAKHGLQLWIDCMAGDPKAWKQMERYNKGDVHPLTDGLYDYFLPWIKGLPNAPLTDGMLDVPRCITCKSKDLRREGNAYTASGQYQRFQCRNCGKWNRGTRRTAGSGLTNVVS